MPILTLQRSMRQLGRIRMGDQVAAGNSGKTRPNKLSTWRLTSPSQELLQAAAGIYGGDVREWEGAPAGRQWELYTDSDTLEVVVPPGDMAFSQWYEMWSGGGCQRRCDGETEQLSDQPCICPADVDERRDQAAKGKACKPTTRLCVIQPHLPDVGLWRLEAHGFYAAVELSGTIEVLRQAASFAGLIPASLRIDQRSVKRDGKTVNFAVPVIELPTLTPHTLMTGEVVAGQLPSGAPAQLTVPRPEIAAGAPAQAPGGEAPAAPVRAATSTPQEPPSIPEQLDAALNKDRRSGAARLMDTVNDDIKKAAARATEGSRPLPSAGSGDGSVFRRVILTKAKKVGMDADGLDAVCRGRVGKNFAEITDPADANNVLAALDGQQVA